LTIIRERMRERKHKFHRFLCAIFPRAWRGPMPQLLSPAGNMDKLKLALLYGADAVYLAGQEFGMRAAADNFTTEELFTAVEYAHAHRKQVFLTLNTMPRWDEFPAIERFLDSIRTLALDGVIVADGGVFNLVQTLLPHVPIHISTQAGASSHADCAFWHNLGASRVVLARELSLADIREIADRVPQGLELEAFVHGSMCISVSGRCLLSDNMTPGRQANRGACTQPCRWNYDLFEIEDITRPAIRYPVRQNTRGSFIMASRDMCMIEYIPELMQSGLSCFKIEGRMKSGYYAAVTANAYRMAMTAHQRGDGYNPAWYAELCSVSHREYSTGHYFASPMDNAQLVTSEGYLKEKSYLAVCSGYEPATKRAYFTQRNKTRQGEVELLTPGQVGVAFVVEDMRDAEGQPIENAPHPYMEFSVYSERALVVGDILRER